MKMSVLLFCLLGLLIGIADLRAQSLSSLKSLSREIKARRILDGSYQRGEFLLPRSKKQILKRVLNTGPNRWVGTAMNPQGDLHFTRGITGGQGGYRWDSGLEETWNLLNGNIDARHAHWVFAGPSKEAVALQGLTIQGSNFARPFQVKGRIPRKSFGVDCQSDTPGVQAGIILRPAEYRISNITHIQLSARKVRLSEYDDRYFDNYFDAYFKIVKGHHFARVSRGAEFHRGMEAASQSVFRDNMFLNLISDFK